MKIIIIEQVCPLDDSTVMQQMHMMTRPEPFTDTVCYLVARELVVTTCLPGKKPEKSCNKKNDTSGTSLARFTWSTHSLIPMDVDAVREKRLAYFAQNAPDEAVPSVGKPDPLQGKPPLRRQTA